MTRTRAPVCFLFFTLFFVVLHTAAGDGAACPKEAVLTAEQGVNRTLTSPNYPGYYSNNQNCGWRIKAPNSWSIVRLYVMDIHMENSTNCGFDSLTFYDGGHKLLAKFCGIHQSGPALDYGKDVLIKFRSDLSVSGRGFKLHYTTVPRENVPTTLAPTSQFHCGRKGDANYSSERILTAEVRVKTLISPNYPNSYYNQYCGWKIKAEREGYAVHIFLVDLQLSDLFFACEFYSLSLYDSDTANGLLLTKMCGDNHYRKTYYSSGRYMYIQFQTGSFGTTKGFKLLYSATKPPSSMTTDMPYVASSMSATTTNKYLRSNGYPLSYSSKERRFWTIRCEPGYAVQLHVEDMDLQNSNICTGNAVTVLNSGDGMRSINPQFMMCADYMVLAKMCNYQYNGVNLYSTKGQVMFVRFTTFTNRRGKGFSLRYRAVSSRQTFSSYTTRVPSTSSTLAPDSQDDSNKSSISYSHVTVVIGVIGGCLALFIIVMFVRRSYFLNKQAQRPRVEHPSTVTSRSGPTPASASRGVYTVPTSQPTAPVDGFTNLAYTEEPPAYSSLQHNPPVVPAAPVPSSPEPPAYTEAMKLTYPPSYDGVNGDAPTQP